MNMDDFLERDDPTLEEEADHLRDEADIAEQEILPELEKKPEKKKSKSKTKKKKKKTKKQLSEIAMRAVQTRRERYPEWGQKKREKDEAKNEV